MESASNRLVSNGDIGFLSRRVVIGETAKKIIRGKRFRRNGSERLVKRDWMFGIDLHSVKSNENRYYLCISTTLGIVHVLTISESLFVKRISGFDISTGSVSR